MVQPKTRTAASAGRSARRPWIWSPAGLVLLGACAAFGPPDIETTRTYQDVGPDELYGRTLQALRASELEVTETDRASGTITAAGRFEERNWAECPRQLRLVEDQEERTHLVPAREDYRRVELHASVQGSGQGATLTLDPAFSAEPVSEFATTAECATTGALERQILEAVTGQA